jgi:hypothetical protein
MKRRLNWVASVLGLGAFLGTLPAMADPPATANVLQIGLGFRYGFEMEDGDFNPWGAGLGVSAGYTLPMAVYVGGNFDYFFGETVEVAGGELSGNIWQLMAEGGYDLGVGDTFVIRPKLGLGFASVSTEGCFDFGLGAGEQCTDDSSMEFAMAPGATFIYLGSKFSLSADLRYDMIFAEEQANALLLSVGIGF